MPLQNEGYFKPVRLADLVVPAYQREGNERSSREVEDNFNPKLLQSITVAEIPASEMVPGDQYLMDLPSQRSETAYVLVDGLQRSTGLAHLHPDGDAELMAQVFHYVPRDEQIALFVGLNRGSVRVKDYWIYRAKESSGHPGITAIAKTLANAGFRVQNGGSGANKGSDGIPSVGLLTRFCGVDLANAKPTEANPDALKALHDALHVITALWPTGLSSSAQRTSAGVVFGLARIFLGGVRPNGKPLTVDEVLGQVHKFAPQLTPGMLLASSNALKAKETARGATSGGASAVRYTTDAWLELLNKQRRNQALSLDFSKPLPTA
jgi:hypothetical protein